MANAKDKGKETIHEGYDKAKEAKIGDNLRKPALLTMVLLDVGLAGLFTVSVPSLLIERR